MTRPDQHRSVCSAAHAIAALVLSLASTTVLAAPPDPGLVQALDGIWQRERPGVSPLSDAFTRDPESDPPRYSTPVKGAPTYVTTDAENGLIELGRKTFPANESPWGPLPLLNTEDAELLEFTVPKRRYLVISAVGSGLYGIGDWQRFGFLHVVDVSARNAPLHYPLVADAGLRDKVLGRLPGSAVLNYARLVPSRWASNTQPNGYEVLLYALNPKGIERVIGDDGRPLAYLVSRNDVNSAWTLQRTPATPITNVRDNANRAFSAPPLKNALTPAPPSGDAASATAATAAATPPAAPTVAAAPTVESKATAQSDAEAAKKQARKEKSDARKNVAKDAAKDIAKDTAKDAASDAAGDAVKKAIPSIR